MPEWSGRSDVVQVRGARAAGGQFTQQKQIGLARKGRQWGNWVCSGGLTQIAILYTTSSSMTLARDGSARQRTNARFHWGIGGSTRGPGLHLEFTIYP